MGEEQLCDSSGKPGIAFAGPIHGVRRVTSSWAHARSSVASRPGTAVPSDSASSTGRFTPWQTFVIIEHWLRRAFLLRREWRRSIPRLGAARRDSALHFLVANREGRFHHSTWFALLRGGAKPSK